MLVVFAYHEQVLPPRQEVKRTCGLIGVEHCPVLWKFEYVPLPVLYMLHDVAVPSQTNE